jgi:hypothetical protein
VPDGAADTATELSAQTGDPARSEPPRARSPTGINRRLESLVSEMLASGLDRCGGPLPRFERTTLQSCAKEFGEPMRGEQGSEVAGCVLDLMSANPASNARQVRGGAPRSRGRRVHPVGETSRRKG